MSEQPQAGAELDPFEEKDSDPSEDLTESEGVTPGESPQKPDLGSVNRQRQVQTWVERIEKGEATIDQLPKAQEWLKPIIEEEVKTRAQTNDVDAIVKRTLQEERKKENEAAQKRKLQEMTEKLNSLDLDPSTKALAKAKYTSFIQKGMSRADALEESLSVVEALQQGGEKALEEAKNAMKIPLKTKQVDDNDPEYGTEEFTQHGDSKSRVEKLEKIRTGGGMK